MSILNLYFVYEIRFTCKFRFASLYFTRSQGLLSLLQIDYKSLNRSHSCCVSPCTKTKVGIRRRTPGISFPARLFRKLPPYWDRREERIRVIKDSRVRRRDAVRPDEPSARQKMILSARRLRGRRDVTTIDPTASRTVARSAGVGAPSRGRPEGVASLRQAREYVPSRGWGVSSSTSSSSALFPSS